jgi:hypothetical protein
MPARLSSAFSLPEEEVHVLVRTKLSIPLILLAAVVLAALLLPGRMQRLVDALRSA